MSVQDEENFHSSMASAFVPIHEWMVADDRESKSRRFFAEGSVYTDTILVFPGTFYAFGTLMI